MTLLLEIIFGLAALYFVLTGSIYLFQRRLMYAPHRHVNTPHRNESPDLETIELKTADGLTLVSYYKAPRSTESGKPFPTVLYLHGNTGPAGDAAHKLIPVVNAGYGVLLLEYRGYGGNPGHPSEEGLIADAEAGLDFILSKQGDDARVYYYGMSLGTGVANGLAERRPPAGLIQECGFTSMTDAAKVRYPMFPVRHILKDTYESKRRIAKLKAPLLVLHGEKDKTVPVEQGKAIFEAAGSANKTLKLYPAGHHVDLYDFGAGDDVVDWLLAVGASCPPGGD